MNIKRKIINDPVYGFITIDHPILFKIIAHPYYQRLRRIHQMALAYLVYPGAVHTRLHHSLGAYHLMCLAITELKAKGTEITEEEEIAVKAAILLHDIGHGAFSHALEKQILNNIHHEELSLKMMKVINSELNGQLDTTIAIFTNNYPKKFLHQLVSGQLDVDRMDYLTRDSFFTGVSEGVIGYDRIIKMLIVHNGELMVEEKGIYSIEKFLVARRQMYWQVYLHKTVVAAEVMLVNILKRVNELSVKDKTGLQTDGALDYFLFEYTNGLNLQVVEKFSELDDSDLSFAIKKWSKHKDFVLSTLCKKLLARNLYKIKLQSKPFNSEEINELQVKAMQQFKVDSSLIPYFVHTGTANNTMYKTEDERINILYKDGTVKDISAIDNPLIHQTISAPIKKFYICLLEP
ncbi:MAG TPA: HD domain-containing protein [Chitinophagaceae bacterium]|nr:HD domain-containing protein [Chitinophagaceae bacterium]MCC6635530.1 HD domain-containing protein [Chitinophagaceae bacterium]HMZ45848.1 HD domain-containing protein [Chitinophagaceae bacterium]HNF28868.1 HD domain-containing protein [Chitinophagaceae bacterium]HNJ57502.1 HD domain-containing protein [Chitinophagaceae bacterium]